MKFIFADSLDMVDPKYDMVQDRHAPKRRPYWDDVYPHQILGYAPYDGILVSRGIVGDHRVSGKYTQSQAMRLQIDGARKFLRIDNEHFRHLAVFGDCGAFTYAKEDVPPYSSEEMIEFYDQCGFSHGCSVDHIIFDYEDGLDGLEGATPERLRRFDITLANAAEFLPRARRLEDRFTPLGVVQGWSPGSMAVAAERLVKLGYDYLAIGGMVPLKSDQIRRCLRAIRSRVPGSTRLHVLGFGKADDIDSFVEFRMTSFDTTSPLLRAFKDERQNYYLPTENGRIRYYTAIRVPQSIENPRLQRLVKRGAFRSEDLIRLEKASLDVLRAFDRNEADVEETVASVMAYNAVLVAEKPYNEVAEDPKIKALASRYRETLDDRPWRKCGCEICRSASIDVLLFRASNRNKRRGIHNLGVYKKLIDGLDLKERVA
jgi:hypothetical protein